MLRNCSTVPAVCWPCEAGFRCDGALRRSCDRGLTWSKGSESECRMCSGACGPGKVLVRECELNADRVCSDCPPGFECNGTGITPCPAGTYSVNGSCESCPPHYSSSVGSGAFEDCVCEARSDGGCGCVLGEVFVGGLCRRCPDGYSCEAGAVSPCPPNTYSIQGVCAACVAHSSSKFGAFSLQDCICHAGYVKVNPSGQCSACKAGTLWKLGKCVPCPAGEYCVGRLHHAVCPIDMWSRTGSAECRECRPNSNCRHHCVSAVNCTCDDGYIDVHGDCRRR